MHGLIGFTRQNGRIFAQLYARMIGWLILSAGAPPLPQHFAATLELAKAGHVEIRQEENFAHD